MRNILLLTTLIPSLLAAQARSKVYISVDMEGIAGVVSDAQTSSTGSEYGWARKLMLEGANAAIRGAIAGGAPEKPKPSSPRWTRSP